MMLNRTAEPITLVKLSALSEKRLATEVELCPVYAAEYSLWVADAN